MRYFIFQTLRIASTRLHSIRTSTFWDRPTCISQGAIGTCTDTWNTSRRLHKLLPSLTGLCHAPKYVGFVIGLTLIDVHSKCWRSIGYFFESTEPREMNKSKTEFALLTATVVFVYPAQPRWPLIVHYSYANNLHGTVRGVRTRTVTYLHIFALLTRPDLFETIVLCISMVL